MSHKAKEKKESSNYCNARGQFVGGSEGRDSAPAPTLDTDSACQLIALEVPAYNKQALSIVGGRDLSDTLDGVEALQRTPFGEHNIYL